MEIGDRRISVLKPESSEADTACREPPVLIPNFEISPTYSSAVTVIAIAGELDLRSAPVLDERLRRDHRPGTMLVVDLTRLDFMDCAGLQVLLSTSQRLPPGDFVLTPGSPQVQMLLELADFEGLGGTKCPDGPCVSGR